MSMSSTLVIKVKCGDTLRRFNFCVYYNERFGVNVMRLREKIRSLFSLGEGCDDFRVTYADAEGDMVALVEDCDLEEVLLQGLNPVRMFVNLKVDDKGGDGVKVPETIKSVLTNVEGVVKRNVPEMFHEVVLKFTRDLAAAVSSAPAVGDVICSTSEIGKSIACQGLKTVYRKESDVQTGDSVSEFSSGSSSSSISSVLRAEKLTGEDQKNKAEEETNFGLYRLPDLNCSPPLPSDFLMTKAASSARGNSTVKANTHFQTAFGNAVNSYNECPFSGTQLDVMLHSSPMGNTIRGLKPGHHPSDSVGPVFHTDVQCDVCSVQPITGPRFTSKVRYNYDLCNVCYQKSASKAEYIRIDHPLLYQKVMKTFHCMQKIEGPDRKPVPLVNQVSLDCCFISDVNVIDGTVMAPSARFIKIWRMKNTGNVAWPLGTQLVWLYGTKFSSALSVDVEIPADGLPVDSELDVAVDFVAPEQPGEYASYWRMSSPSGRQFGHRVWVVIQVDGSHELLSSNFSRLNLNLPPQNNGLEDLIVSDINVDRLLNIPYSPSNSSSPPSLSSKLSAVVECFAEVLDDDNISESKESTAETKESAGSKANLNVPTNDTLLPVAFPCVHSDSFVDTEIDALPMNASLSVRNLAPSPQSEHFSETTEHGVLSELVSNQAELDNEILKTMDSHLEQAHDFLCGMFGWDQILEELEKMGFSDKKKNVELVLKNKGSIKRVVMELVAFEKSQK